MQPFEAIHIPANPELPVKRIKFDCFEDLQAAVGGWVERISLDDIDVLGNEEAKVRATTFIRNWYATHGYEAWRDYFAGEAFVAEVTWTILAHSIWWAGCLVCWAVGLNVLLFWMFLMGLDTLAIAISVLGAIAATITNFVLSFRD